MLACPGVLTKVTTGSTGFSTAVMVDRSFWDWYSFMAPDCLVPLEDYIVEGGLVLALGFH